MIPAPAVPGPERQMGEIPDPDSYEIADEVWVYRDRDWHPGQVEGKANLALMVRYWHKGGGSATDTMSAAYVARRGERETAA